MILDTSALSAMADGEPSVLKTTQVVETVEIPVIVLGEFRFGIAQSRHEKSYQKWLGGLVATIRVLDITEETTNYYSTLRLELRRTGTPLPANDVWIAALCRQHDLPILSRDKHFDCVKQLRRLSW